MKTQQREKKFTVTEGKISKRYVSCCGVRNAEVAQFFITLRGGQRPFGRILNSSILRSKQSTLELFYIIFEKGSSKGPSGKNIMKFCNFQRILDIYCQWLLKALSRQEKLFSIAYFVMVIIHTCFVFVLGALLSYFVCYVSMFLTLLFHNRLF